ncbi:phytanoyl-CoA dioxygenase family protein [Spirosoma litoris]
MTTPLIELPPSTENSRLGILHLKRYWAKAMATRQGLIASGSLQDEWNLDVTLLSALGLGLEQTIRYLYNTAPTFPEFEDWIQSVTVGLLDASQVASFNALFIGNQEPQESKEDSSNVLSADDLTHWDKYGYVIVRNAVSHEDCEQTIQLICETIDIERYQPETWYRPNPMRQGIMVQLFQHPILTKNRSSSRIRKAYEQLWNRTDLWVSTDRVGFNPPETESWQFPGPHLHWDVSLTLPIPFGLQGILYLSNTQPNQGAFTLVPGFQHRIDDWIAQLPPQANPRTQNLHALGATPIAANAGDFIIWHQALPHGSSPNRSAEARFVQYINYAPAHTEVKPDWK